MNNLYLAFSVVFPLFCMMALGYGLQLVGILNERFTKDLNNLCFKVFLPMLLFLNIYNSDFEALFAPKLILFAVGSVCITFLVLMLTVPLFVKENLQRGVVIQGIFRSNYILFGLPIATAFYGEEKAAVTAVLIAFVVPLYNILSIIALESFLEGNINVKEICKGVAKNPLVIAAVLSFAVMLSGIRLPNLVVKSMSDIAKVATPLALIALGGSFQFSDLGHAPKALVGSLVSKLILIPTIGLGIAVAIGFRGAELLALLSMIASPTAVSSYTMAQARGADDILAGQIVVVGSLVSILTVFVWLTIGRQLGLL